MLLIIISISNYLDNKEQKNLEYDNIKGILERSKYQINQIPSNEFEEREKNQIMFNVFKSRTKLESKQF